MAVPTIILQPTGLSILAGETGFFSGEATGADWYIWYDLIGGVTGYAGDTGTGPLATLYILDAQTANAGDYWFVAGNTDGDSSDSDHVTLTVNYLPSISLDLVGTTGINGTTGVFPGGATGTAPINFEWYSNIVGITGTLAETAATLYLPNLSASNEGSYAFVARNAYGYVQSSDANLDVIYMPSIVQQPTGMTVMLGGTGMFSVGVTGDQPINLAWYKRIAGVTGVLGETGLKLYVLNVTETNEGYYSCVPRNVYGDGAASNDALLTVTTTAVITQQPLSQQTLYNGMVDFTVTAVTDPSFSTLYQWKKNGASMFGATGASLEISNIQSSDLAYYMVTITNGGATLNSNLATITIRSNPLNSPFSDIGMPGLDQDTAGRRLRNVQMGNPNGDQVDNAAGHRLFGTRSQGLNSNQGGYITWGSQAPNISP